MLDYKKVWSAHKKDNKIAMCTEAMDGVGWSASVFDTRMEDHVASTRRKHKLRKRKQKHAKSSDDDSSGDDAEYTPKKKQRLDTPRETKSPAQTSTPDDKDSDVKVRSYEHRARISLIDAENTPMAHGVIIDDEPPIPNSESDLSGHATWTKHHTELPECNTGTFKKLKIVAIIRCVLFFFSYYYVLKPYLCVCL